MANKKLHPNIESLTRVAKEIGPLLEKVVFVGGATTTLYLTKPEHIAEARGTVDVDIIADVDQKDFYKAEELMRKAGFQHDQKTTFRFLKDDLIVDIIPTDPSVIGFSNRWYKEGFKNAKTEILGGVKLRFLSFPYFLATKLEAFAGRGKGDYYGSKDFEDIVTVLAGRSGFLAELLEIKGSLRNFLRSEFAKHVANESFRDAIRGHIPRISNIEKTAGDIAADIREYVEIDV